MNCRALVMLLFTGAITLLNLKVVAQTYPDNIVSGEGCIVPFQKIDFTVKEKWETVNGTANANTGNLVGDLDGDGIPEVITIANSLTRINILNGSNGSIKGYIDVTSFGGTNGWHPVSTAVLVNADNDNYGEIVLATSDLKLRSFEANVDAGGNFSLIQRWGTTFVNPSTTDKLPQPVVADFNGDGTPEVLVYNQIFNALTGAKIGETEALKSGAALKAYVGRIPGRGGNQNTNFIALGDFDGDGLPEVAAGGKVYKVTINAAGTALTSSILYSTSAVGDGYTAVADVNMDGNLDVIVVDKPSGTRINVWSPITSTVIDQFTVAPSVYQGYPFIGDIDGVVDPTTNKKYPEICVVTVSAVNAFKYVSSTKKFTRKWTLSNSDSSGGTGITLFDFNNDGINEIVYRDMKTLGIYNGVKDTIPTLAHAVAEFTCGSGTAFEYPTIADIDGDGSANVCVTCTGVLKAFESKGDPWAPTRKVWNQVNYDPVLINENLTVPTRIFPKHHVFTIDGKDYAPYNGALIQVPITDINMVPIVQASDPYVVSIGSQQLNATTARITVTVGNSGLRNVNSSLPITLYKESASVTNKLETKTLGATLTPSSTTNVTFDVPISSLPTQLEVRLQDDGSATYPAAGSYLDCNLDNNKKTVKTLIALNDASGVGMNGSKVVDVLANDKLSSCTSSNITLEVTAAPSNGSAVVEGGKIKYTPQANYTGTDNFTYKITCGSQSSTATVSLDVQAALVIKKLNDASEPNTVGKFLLTYNKTGYTYNKALDVDYLITTNDTNDLTNSLAGKIRLPANATQVEFTITPKNNFKVDGNREVEIEITNVTAIP